jgi:ribosomal protein S12 methylthiotransferase accessory factor
MEMMIDFPGGARVDAHFGEFTVKTDQPPKGGGESSAPTPFNIFMASIGACAGIYVLGFCRQRDLPVDDIRIVQRIGHSENGKGPVGKIELEIQVPPSFPEKYHKALVRSADQCLVKQVIANPPEFDVHTTVLESLGAKE